MRTPLDARIRGFGFCLPGSPIPLERLATDDAMRKRLPGLRQEFTYVTDRSSTELMIDAAREALDLTGTPADRIALIVTAPSLISGYGMEIPAVAVRAALGLKDAECLNLGQGCVGLLRGMEIAARRLAAEPEGDVLVVTGCRASAITRAQNHGAFFWGDGAAAVLLTAAGPGLHVAAYAESSADANWGAMRVPFGDERTAENWSAPEDLRLTVRFPSADAQSAYIEAEMVHFAKVLRGMCDAASIAPAELGALALPSFGYNRIQLLVSEFPGLRDRVITDFRFPHMGSADLALFVSRWAEDGAHPDDVWIAAMTPAYTAQWGGILMRHAAP